MHIYIISMMCQTIMKLLVLLLVGLVSYLLLSDTPLGVEPNKPLHFSLDKKLTDIPNIDLDRLRNARYIQFPGYVVEDVAVNTKGDIIVAAGVGPSNIYYGESTNISDYKKIATTTGRVLGTALSFDQKLFAFVDEQEGLKILDLHTYETRVVASEYEGRKLISINSVTFTSNPDIIYFTHSCNFSMQQYHNELLYKQGKGQVFQLNLKTKKLRPILGGLQFANGIVYSQKQNCLFVVQINHYRVIKISLQQNSIPFKFSVVIDNLIGYPDNLKMAQDGNIWLAIPSLRDSVNILIDNQPLIRKALINLRIPQHIFTKFANFSYSGGLKIDPQSGKVIDYFFGKPNKINFVTGIYQRNRKLYIASIKHNLIAVVDYL